MFRARRARLGGLLPERDVFAIIFAATIALNGQKWYPRPVRSAGTA